MPPQQQAPSRNLRGLSLPDYRKTDIAGKHIRRGLCLLIRHAPTAAILPLALSLAVCVVYPLLQSPQQLCNEALKYSHHACFAPHTQLFLEERLRSGDLGRLWSVAVQTDLTFNLVSFAVLAVSVWPTWRMVTPTLT